MSTQVFSSHFELSYKMFHKVLNSLRP